MFNFFSLVFILKLDEPFRNQEIFIISLFSIVQIWVLRFNFFFCSFWLIFCPLDPDPWIRIFLRNRIRIQEAKILRILSTALYDAYQNEVTFIHTNSGFLFRSEHIFHLIYSFSYICHKFTCHNTFDISNTCHNGYR